VAVRLIYHCEEYQSRQQTGVDTTWGTSSLPGHRLRCQGIVFVARASSSLPQSSPVWPGRLWLRGRSLGNKKQLPSSVEDGLRGSLLPTMTDGVGCFPWHGERKLRGTGKALPPRAFKRKPFIVNHRAALHGRRLRARSPHSCAQHVLRHTWPDRPCPADLPIQANGVPSQLRSPGLWWR